MPSIFKHFRKWTQPTRKKPFVFESPNEKDIQRFLLGVQVAKAAAEKGEIRLRKISDHKIALHAIKEKLS